MSSSVSHLTLVEACLTQGHMNSIIDSNTGLWNEELLNCISNRMDSLRDSYTVQNTDFHQWMFVLAGSLVFFMQAGFAMLCAGCVRKKNLQNTMLKNLLDVTGAAVTFYLVGYALAFGGDDMSVDSKTFVGTTGFFSHGVDYGFWFFQFTLAATCVTIVAGTLAERCQMTAYLWYSIFLTAGVYPVAAHAVWSAHGIFSIASADPWRGIGVIDFAGSGVIHATGGMASLAATYVLGPRSGRFTNAQSGEVLAKPKEFPGSSIALQVLGTMLLWFGWYGFNPGSALLLPNQKHVGSVAGLAACNTSLAGAAGAASAMVTNLYIQKIKHGTYSFSLSMTMNGALGGLVAITSGCGTVELWASVVIGIIAGWGYMLGSYALIHFHLDDVVDGIPVHLVNGVWGMLATGLFSSPSALRQAYGNDAHVGFFYSLGSRDGIDTTLFVNQLTATVFILAWAGFLMYPFFLFLNYMEWLRADGLEEVVGLDIRYHGGATKEAHAEVEEDVANFREERQKTLKDKSRRNRNGSTESSAGSDENV